MANKALTIIFIQNVIANISKVIRKASMILRKKLLTHAVHTRMDVAHFYMNR